MGRHYGNQVMGFSPSASSKSKPMSAFKTVMGLDAGYGTVKEWAEMAVRATAMAETFIDFVMSDIQAKMVPVQMCDERKAKFRLHRLEVEDSKRYRSIISITKIPFYWFIVKDGYRFC